MKLAHTLLFLTLSALLGQTALAAEKSHGLSIFGELKYPADFKHFEYANPKAPKGGRFSMVGPASLRTFNSFNGYITLGTPAQGLGYASGGIRTLFDQLMVRAWDEPDAVYGLVAHSVLLADDKRSVTFYLRKEAKFSDGTPLTAEDVKFSFELIKEHGLPGYSIPLQDVAKASVIDPYTITYEFKGDNIRDLPINVATLPIFSKAFYTQHEFKEPSLEIPIGSGPYIISKYKKNQFVTYKRRADYWAKDLPVNVGHYNFDTLNYHYYKDRNIDFEAFKGGKLDFREEFTSKRWATQYNFRALKEGKVKRLVTPDGSPSGAQGFFLNTRRPQFKDPRVRKAIALAFDFEWTNKNLFHNLYIRTHSYFENSQMKAEGLPSKEELALLEPFRKDLPEEIFTKAAYSQPKSNGSGSDRRLFRQASRLLKQAGWTVKNGVRVNAEGKPLRMEFLIFEPSFNRIILPYVDNLKVLGVQANIRLVDPTQFENRSKKFDYDIRIQRYSMSLTPGAALRNYFHSNAATIEGSYNLSGINSPVIDMLLDKITQAKSREQLTTATRALDRVLRAGHYWVPHWYKASHTLAFWQKFSRPKIKPKYRRGITDLWWYTPTRTKTK